MNQKKKMDLLYTVIGIAMMCPIMVIFNKYLALGEVLEEPFTNPVFWKSVLMGVLQRVPVVFVLQYFIVQPFAERKTAQHTREEDDVYIKMTMRTAFSVIILCPVLSFYSQILLIIEGRLTSFSMVINNWLPAMAKNWVFAFFLHAMIVGPLNRKAFLAIVKRMKKKDAHN